MNIEQEKTRLLALADEDIAVNVPEVASFLVADIRDFAALIRAMGEENEKLRAAMQDILCKHANDNVRPAAFYIASKALENKHES